ncbi:MAG TPA: hypothetical protein VH394_08775 [Thermoanaerobaculia bacterium]|nr:hypothetical protein [Thermoanaerobaculia bacterium]
MENDTRIALDNAGIANWNFQNPRRPYPIVHKRAGVGLVQAADETCFAQGLLGANVVFVNDTPDRLFEVRVPYTLPATRVSDIVNNCALPAPQKMAETLSLQGQTTTFDAACEEVARTFNTGSNAEIGLPLLEICAAHWLGNPPLSPEQANAKTKLVAPGAVGQTPEYCALITSLFGDLSNAPAFEKAFSNACSKSPRGGYDCTYSLQVGLGTTTPLDKALLQYLANTASSFPGLLTFQVFFVGESELPSHNLGYLQVKPKFDEPQSSTVWQLSGSVGATTDADFNQPEPLAFNAASGAKEDAVNPFVSPKMPYRGAREDDFNGSASFKLIQKLGNRAEGSATLSFKSGNLGEADQERKAVVSDYSLRLFGDNGTQLRFGKYELATGRESIALLEKGETAELLWRFASLGAVFKRENVDGPPAKKTEGSRSLVLQLKDLSLARLRSFNLLGVYGRNDGQPTFDNLFPSPDPEHVPEAITDNERFVVAYNYKTVGGDASFALPATPTTVISGNFAGYYSKRDISEVTTKAGEKIADRVDPTGKIKDGDGKVALLSVVVARTGVTGKPSPSSFRLQVGWGSGDKAGTPENEGYLGETTGFVPDKIFIARLAPVIRGGLVSAGQGLANKTYTGFTYTNTRCYPALPLVVLARMIGIQEGVSDCNSRARLHHYSLNEEVFESRGRTAGDEIDVEFSITVPKGVTTSLGFGRFRPGNALQDVVKGQPWVLTAGVSVTM